MTLETRFFIVICPFGSCSCRYREKICRDLRRSEIRDPQFHQKQIQDMNLNGEGLNDGDYDIDFVSMVLGLKPWYVDCRECLSLMKYTETMEPNSVRTSLVEQVHSFHIDDSNLLGTYALIGARIFYPSPLSARVAMIVDMGNDFPPTTLDTLNHLNCSILFRQTPKRKTTRGYNLYGPGELRSRYTSRLN